MQVINVRSHNDRATNIKQKQLINERATLLDDSL